MDANKIYNDFAHTLSPNLEERKAAEHSLETLRYQDGFVGALLQILANASSSSSVKQAVAIFLKRLIENGYDKSEDCSDRISDADKALLRSVIFDAIVHSEPSIQVQWLKCLQTIVDVEFPHGCQHLIAQVEKAIRSSDPKLAHGGLLTLQQIFSVFRWKPAKQRKPVHELIKKIFGELVQIGSQLAALDCSNQQAGKALHLICKSYFNSIQYELSKPQQKPESISAWGALFMALVQKDIPEEVQPADKDDRPEFPWWKAKKWAYHCLNRLFIRYGNPREVDKNYKDFANKFINSVAVPILQAYLMQVEMYVKGRFVTPSSLCLLCDFLSAAIKHHITWNALKPHVLHLVSLFILPLLQLDEEDIELYNDDSVEFIRKLHDFANDFKSARQSASELLEAFIEDRPKSTFTSIMGLLNTELAKGDLSSLLQDALLHAVHVLATHIKSSGMPFDSLLQGYVYPELSNKVGYVRMRALCVVEVFADAANLPEIDGLFQKVMDLLLHDSDSPVAIQAASTLQELLENHSEVQKLLAPHVPMVLKKLLDLTNQVDVDTLGCAMESMVENFPEEVAPFAVELAGQLALTFGRLIEPAILSNATSPTTPAELSSLQETQDNTMAALSIVKTIITLVYSVKSSPDLLGKMEQVVVPVCRVVLEHDLCDYFEEIVEILTAIVFHRRTVSDYVWACLVPLFNSLRNNGEDYISDAVPFMDNVASYGKDRFAKQPEVVQWYLEMARIGLQDETLARSDRAMVCDLLQSLVLNLHEIPGILESSLPSILQGLMEKLKSLYENGAQPSTKSAIAVFYVQVILDVLYIQPQATLGWMVANDAGCGFFALWFDHLDKFVRVHDKRLSILVMARLLSMPLHDVAEPLRQYWPHMLKSMITLLGTMPQALYNKQKILREHEEGSRSGNSEDGEYERTLENADVGDNQDVVDEAADDYMRYLAREAQKALQKKGGVIDDESLAALGNLTNPSKTYKEDNDILENPEGEDGEEDSDDSDYDSLLNSDDFDEDDDDLLDEDVYFTTPLDKIDAYQTAQQCLNSLSQIYGEDLAQQWSQLLTPDNRKAITEIMGRANEEVALALYAEGLTKQ